MNQSIALFHPNQGHLFRKFSRGASTLSAQIKELLLHSHQPLVCFIGPMESRDPRHSTELHPDHPHLGIQLVNCPKQCNPEAFLPNFRSIEKKRLTSVSGPSVNSVYSNHGCPMGYMLSIVLKRELKPIAPLLPPESMKNQRTPTRLTSLAPQDSWLRHLDFQNAYG